MNRDDAPSRTDVLGLATVLTNDLPTTLHTAGAPERYKVSAVFSRRPSPQEVTGITSSTTREALTAAGYPTIELAVSDRRLEIDNTNLEELADGLATVLADQLERVSVEAATERDRAAAALAVLTQQETDRAALVALAAAAITFRPSGARDAEPPLYS